MQTIKTVGIAAAEKQRDRQNDGSNFLQYVQRQADKGGFWECAMSADHTVEYVFWATPEEATSAILFGDVFLQVCTAAAALRTLSSSSAL